MAKPPSKPLPTSPKGIKALKEHEFRDMYEWQLDEFGKSTKKIITLIPLEQYFEIGILCIRHDMSISAFIREAMFDRKDDIPKISKKMKAKAAPTHHESQGTLF
jgi:predicted transcriptional regulator YheO